VLFGEHATRRFALVFFAGFAERNHAPAPASGMEDEGGIDVLAEVPGDLTSQSRQSAFERIAAFR
jgi:hypothetical protein